MLLLTIFQQFDVMTAHKVQGRRWVTKEQYIWYFILYSQTLADQSLGSEEEARLALEVWNVIVSRYVSEF